jgi:hypothetical protein
MMKGERNYNTQYIYLTLHCHMTPRDLDPLDTHDYYNIEAMWHNIRSLVPKACIILSSFDPSYTHHDPILSQDPAHIYSYCCARQFLSYWFKRATRTVLHNVEHEQHYSSKPHLSVTSCGWELTLLRTLCWFDLLILSKPFCT